MMRTAAIAAALIFSLALGAATPAGAQSVTVTIGGRPISLNPAPIEQTGRVFVPLRGVFEQLGATVVYSNGQINATRGQTTVSLTIGSTQALINGHVQYLDVAPFIVGSYTYVPLRFLAQSLGATVNYVSSSNLVQIGTPGRYVPVRPPNSPPPPPPRPQPAAPAPAVGLASAQPANGATIANRFPVISATFTRRVNAGSVRVLLDGGAITGQCGISQTGFSYKPPAPLSFGSHTVRVAGSAIDGSLFDRRWSFVVAGAPPPPPAVRLSITVPAPNAAVGTNFMVRGKTIANARVQVTAGAGAGGTGQFTGSTNAGSGGNFAIRVAISALLGQQAVYVRIVATDPVSGRSNQTTLQLRIK